jgi:hypothetical protein
VLTLYRCLLYLYPAAYRQEFGEEMTSVFSEAWQSMAQNLPARFLFCAREVRGLVFSAVREHLHVLLGSGNSFGRIKMRPEFRFPRSTVVLMLAIFAGVVLTIVKATGVELAYGVTFGTVWPSLISILVCMVLTMFAVAAIGWGVLHALGRTGAHRMANIEIWPKAK